LLYLTFRQFPFSQFLSGLVVGIIWGYVYVKRGFGTAVLAHTLSDFLPMLFLI
jgi:membrane protease YdiL (CAAX protease family)